MNQEPSHFFEDLIRNSELTSELMQQEAEDRISVILQEFKAGFAFINNYPTSVTFFGSARFSASDQYYRSASELAQRVVKELNYAVVTGGGPGIMEAANRGAQEAGGQSLGLTIKLPQEQATNPYVTDQMDFYYFFSRKVCLSFSAEAYVFFPGGFGTLDEFFEILTLVQTQKIRNTPLLLYGCSYWQPLTDFIDKQLKTLQTINPQDTDLYTITDDPDLMLEMIRSAPIKRGVRHSPGSPVHEKRSSVDPELTGPTDH